MSKIIIDTSLLDDVWVGYFSKEEFEAILEQLETMGCIVTRD